MMKTDEFSWLFWLYQPYKWLIYIPVMLVNSVLFALLATIMSLLISPRTGSLMGKIWALNTCWLTLVKVKVIGRENIQDRKSYVIVSNHQTGFDIFLLYGYLPIDFKWIMKKELRKMPFIGLACEKVGHIFIDRSSPRAAVQTLEEAKRKLVNGTSVLIFPEGTRSGDVQMRTFKKGAFKLALDLELDVLPVTIQNSYRIKRNGFMNLFPGKAGLVIHPMIKADSFRNDINGLMTETRQVIESAL